MEKGNSNVSELIVKPMHAQFLNLHGDELSPLSTHEMLAIHCYDFTPNTGYYKYILFFLNYTTALILLNTNDDELLC